MNVPELVKKQEINKILKCQCINCGGHLEKKEGFAESTYTCKYCGTKYTAKQDFSVPEMYTIKILRPEIKTLGGRFFLAKEHEIYLGAEEAKKIAQSQIVRSISEYIHEHFDEFIELEEDKHAFGEKEYGLFGTEYRATMRVVSKIE